MEADQAKRAQAVVDPDRGTGEVFGLRRERMEMRDANRLREEQDSRNHAGDAASPAPTIRLATL